ncbi:MAG: CHAP domain-containing protein [Janthinobacterium lividum]
MQAIAFKKLLQGAAVAGSCLLLMPAAEARTHRHAHARHYASAGLPVLQCVAFARSNTDIALTGNAANWWQNAEGVYARGSAPEVGSVLNFRANDRMRLGHVAVVTSMVDSRTIQIDQSHWNARGISRDVSVVDVSENNDWTAVRVELGHQGVYGSIYPTYGFIYARPDSSGRIVTARSDVIVPRMANRAPSDLRGGTEVAEMPVMARGIDLSVTNPATSGFVDDAPNRNLR